MPEALAPLESEANSVPDSILAKFLLGKMPSDSLMAKSGVKRAMQELSRRRKAEFQNRLAEEFTDHLSSDISWQ